MAGVKRVHAMMEQPQQNILPMFEHFRAELDQHHDRRERIIKASRDMTAQSKKIIFALQRTRELGKPIPAPISKQTAAMHATVQNLFQTVVPDLQGLNAQRYQANISGGIQEYMEAVLFQHYLETRHLMGYDQAVEKIKLLTTLPPPQQQQQTHLPLQLTYDDYLLGVFDMTGELMRFAVTNFATSTSGTAAAATTTTPIQDNNGSGSGPGDGRDLSILADMQTLRSQLEGLNVAGSGRTFLSKEFESKLRTTKQSVEKVEASVYSILVRGKERPKGWRPDAEPQQQQQPPPQQRGEEIEGF